jgi:4a-hydroxytetrahydrobiopterin dehydratase
MAKLSEAEISERMEKMVGWKHEGEAIQKTFKLPSFPAAIAFVTHVGFLAESAVHHPDVDIRYNNVTISLSTHDVGGISDKDFDLASAIDEIMV